MSILNIPHSPGEPILWWLFWFAVSVVVYAVVIVWFWRAMKRATRPAPGPETAKSGKAGQ